nr:uncharacterized protein LOC127327759 [Lolium perenne]
MSGEEQGAKPATTVRIVETVYIEAGTADDFKAVVQRLTGRDSSATAIAAAENDRADLQAADRRGGGGGRSRGGREVGSTSDVKRAAEVDAVHK